MANAFLFNILLAIFTLLFLSTVFLVSILISKYFNYINEKRQAKFINKWQMELFEYLSSEETPERIISLIPKAKYNHLFAFLRTFLLNLKDRDLERLKELLAEPRILKYFTKNLNSWRREKKIQAIYFLRYIETEEVIELLSKKLDSSNELIFRTATVSLAYLNATNKINRILDITKKRKYLNVDSILSIINKFDRTICPVLKIRLKTEESNIILQVIIIILWYHKYEEAGEELKRILMRSSDKKVVLEAIKYIGEVKDTNALEILQLGLNNSDAEINVAALQAAGKMEENNLENEIINKFGDSQLEVKIAAARAMYNCSSKGKAHLYNLSKQFSDNVDVIIAKRIFIERRLFGNV